MSLASPLCSTIKHSRVGLGGENPVGSEMKIAPMTIPVKAIIATHRERIKRPNIAMGLLLAE